MPSTSWWNGSRKPQTPRCQLSGIWRSTGTSRWSFAQASGGRRGQPCDYSLAISTFSSSSSFCARLTRHLAPGPNHPREHWWVDSRSASGVGRSEAMAGNETPPGRPTSAEAVLAVYVAARQWSRVHLGGDESEDFTADLALKVCDALARRNDGGEIVSDPRRLYGLVRKIGNWHRATLVRKRRLPTSSMEDLGRIEEPAGQDPLDQGAQARGVRGRRGGVQGSFRSRKMCCGGTPRWAQAGGNRSKTQYNGACGLQNPKEDSETGVCQTSQANSTPLIDTGLSDGGAAGQVGCQDQQVSPSSLRQSGPRRPACGGIPS